MNFSYFTTVGAALEEMESGLSVRNLSATKGDALYFTVDVGENVTDLTLKISGGTGDADIYIKQGSEPTLNS